MWVDLRSLWEGPPAGGLCWTADSGSVTADSPFYTADAPVCPAPPSPFTSGLFRVSYQFPDVEGEYARANHQLFFQIARSSAISVRPFPGTPAYRSPEPEGEYSRANHQLYWQVGQRIPARGNALLTYYSAPNRSVEPEADYTRASHQAFFQIARQPPVQQPSLALTLFRVSYRPPETEIEYARGDHQIYWQFRAFTPPVAPEVPPAAGGALLPGQPPCPPEKLGTGMGPYKRPGQVFGEPDPLSPRLSSRAEVAAEYIPRTQLTQQLPLIEFPAPVTLAEQDDTDTVVFALVALDELCGSPTDLLRGPITLKIVRRKI